MSKQKPKQKVTKENKEPIILHNDGTALLPGIGAIVNAGGNSRDMFQDPANDPFPYNVGNKTYRGVVFWGDDNDLPQQILTKVQKCEVLSSGLYFNAWTGYGSGLIPCYYDYDKDGNKIVKHYDFKGKELKAQIRELELKEIDLEDSTNQKAVKELVYVQGDLKEARDQQKIWLSTKDKLKKFYKMNDVNHYIDEQLIDLNFFFMGVPLIVLNKKNEVVQIIHREATFSRWEAKNAKGNIEHMFYSHKWEDTNEPEQKDVIVYKVLDPNCPLYDLEIKTGKELGPDGKKKDDKVYEYIVPLPLPSPGRFYYPNSPWYATFLSGWYDLWTKVPEGKNAIFDHLMNISFQIELSDDYFKKIFEEEGITEKEAMKTRIRKEYDKLNNFLAGQENFGKSIISFVTYTHDGKEQRKMKIIPIENKLKGGEYIEDSEEASNMMSQAIWVHPSIIGASPGKNKSINGTEARELFIIKNAMQVPFRDRVVKPFYIMKEMNGLDPSLEWLIPNIELTTLDENKGSKDVIN